MKFKAELHGNNSYATVIAKLHLPNKCLLSLLVQRKEVFTNLHTRSVT